jgi:hypothetical protein
MTDIAARNRAIKKTLELAFGRGKVRVRGSRGGYVNVHINITPLDWQQEQDLQSQCKAALRAAGVDLGRAYTDDTCESTTDRCSISFNSAPRPVLSGRHNRRCQPNGYFP